MPPLGPMRPSTSMRLPLTCMTATARFCPCLLASSSSRTSFSRCSIILRCLSIRQKKSHRVPSQSRDGGCDQRASRFASSLWPVNGNRGFKTTRGLHRKTEPASNAACCAWCRSDHHLLPSGHLNSVNFHRVTLHCVFEVSPLEIGGFGAVPPSPPFLRKTRYEHRGGFFLRQAAPLHAGSGADKARKAHPLSRLTRNTLCSFGRHRRLALFLNRRPRKEKVRTAENLCGLQDGADCRNRTGDLRVTSALLYQLS